MVGHLPQLIAGQIDRIARLRVDRVAALTAGGEAVEESDRFLRRDVTGVSSVAIPLFPSHESDRLSHQLRTR